MVQEFIVKVMMCTMHMTDMLPLCLPWVTLGEIFHRKTYKNYVFVRKLACPVGTLGEVRIPE